MLYDMAQDYWFSLELENIDDVAEIWYARLYLIDDNKTMWFRKYNFETDKWTRMNINATRHTEIFKLVKNEKLINKLDTKYAKLLLTLE